MAHDIQCQFFLKILLVILAASHGVHQRVLAHNSNSNNNNNNQEVIHNPVFLAALENMTMTQGRDVSFTCVVHDLGSYKVSTYYAQIHSNIDIICDGVCVINLNNRQLQRGTIAWHAPRYYMQNNSISKQHIYGNLLDEWVLEHIRAFNRHLNTEQSTPLIHIHTYIPHTEKFHGRNHSWQESWFW